VKILIFCPYYPPHIGGLESHADEFNKYLSLRGMDISVFTPRLPKDAPEFETRYNGVKIIRFPAFEIVPNYPLPKFWSVKFWRLFFGLFGKKFDIVISRTRFFSTSLLALFYAKIKRIKWIHIEHGSDFVKLSSNFKTAVAKIYDHTFGFLVFRFCDQNISISKAVQKFVEKFDQRESPVIYRGLDLETLEKMAPDLEFQKKYAGKIIITWVGRLYKWKGVEKSIEAVKKLPEEVKNKIVFAVIGNGEDFSYLKKISEKESAIEMVGAVTREKAIGILKISNIYLHSSEPGGGLSTSLLEAMLCGATVVATPHEGADEVIENRKNGILTKSANQEEVKKHIEDLVKNQEMLSTFSCESKKTIKSKFNWDNSIRKYEEIFRNIAK
jgi:glycosyltransferase involved in cell wall biosynthesis